LPSWPSWPSSPSQPFLSILLFSCIQVLSWYKSNPQNENQEVFKHIRFGCISATDLASHVGPAQILPPEKYLRILEFSVLQDSQKFPEVLKNPRSEAWAPPQTEVPSMPSPSPPSSFNFFTSNPFPPPPSSFNTFAAPPPYAPPPTPPAREDWEPSAFAFPSIPSATPTTEDDWDFSLPAPSRPVVTDYLENFFDALTNYSVPDPQKKSSHQTAALTGH
jgi:hypothetical protein